MGVGLGILHLETIGDVVQCRARALHECGPGFHPWPLPKVKFSNYYINRQKSRIVQQFFFFLKRKTCHFLGLE